MPLSVPRTPTTRHQVWALSPTVLQHLPKGLLEELLPGAVTLLLRRRADAPLAPELNPGVDVVGESSCNALPAVPLALCSARPGAQPGRGGCGCVDVWAALLQLLQLGVLVRIPTAARTTSPRVSLAPMSQPVNTALSRRRHCRHPRARQPLHPGHLQAARRRAGPDQRQRQPGAELGVHRGVPGKLWVGRWVVGALCVQLWGGEQRMGLPHCRPQVQSYQPSNPPPSVLPPPPPLLQELWPSVSLVFDGGSLTLGRAGSTVIDLSEPGGRHVRVDASIYPSTCALVWALLQLPATHPHASLHATSGPLPSLPPARPCPPPPQAASASSAGAPASPRRYGC